MLYGMFICTVSCVLFVLSIIRMHSVKKWMKSQIKILDGKKRELNEMIDSATDMVHELNHISDYVVTTVNVKNTELNNTLQFVDEKIAECREMFEQNDKNKVVTFPSQGISQQVVHGRKQEIEELFENGYDVAGIARELGIGKGEIQLILGMTERYLQVAN